MVAIAGGHGKIALSLTERLSGRGERVVSLIRNPDHADDVRARGGEPVVCDLENADAPEIAAAITGASAVVFAAGAGPGSGAGRKLTMDRDGAIKLLVAAEQVGAARYLIISSIGAESPPDDDDVFSVYLRAKAAADEAVQASNRDWTIVRPGPLTDDAGTGTVRVDLEPFRGQIPREDVAALLDVLLTDGSASGRILYVGGGDVPIKQALERAIAPRSGRRTTGDRLALALELLRDPAFDALITGQSAFEDLPDVMARLAAGTLPALCHTITYNGG